MKKTMCLRCWGNFEPKHSHDEVCPDCLGQYRWWRIVIVLCIAIFAIYGFLALRS